jgi:hypothetical protein
MDWKPFWKIIEESYRPDAIDHFELLMEHLGQLKWFEVVEFQARFDEAIAEANNLDLWGAAYLINGGCSDDGFRDFRVWLVGRGRVAYERALRNPDTLADILDGDPVDGFGLDAAALRVYEEKTGMSDFYERLDRAEKDAPQAPSEGADWDFEDPEEMKKRFPNLCHLYLLPADGE